MKSTIVLLAGLLVATAVSAQITVDPVVADVKPVASPTADKTETRIAKEVRHELLMIPYYTLFDDLGFTVRGTHVELTGAVNDGALISEAMNAVKHIEGVEQVSNNIKLLAPLPDDERIRHEAARRIFSTGGLSRYSYEAAPSLHIVVDHGHLRLIGYVLSAADKNMAGIAANQVPGVFSVQNDLQVTDEK